MMHAEAIGMAARASYVLALSVGVGCFLSANCHDTPPPQAAPATQTTPAAKRLPTSSSPAGLTSLATLKTTAESSDYKSTSSYTDVVAFMKAVADAAPSLVHYTTYGMTSE